MPYFPLTNPIVKGNKWDQYIRRLQNWDVVIHFQLKFRSGKPVRNLRKNKWLFG